jgi:hypothetical protein
MKNLGDELGSRLRGVGYDTNTHTAVHDEYFNLSALA